MELGRGGFSIRAIGRRTTKAQKEGIFFTITVLKGYYYALLQSLDFVLGVY